MRQSRRMISRLNTRTSVRRIILRCNPSDLDKIPHTISVDGNQVLLTVRGHPPICLKCGESGHIRSKCTAEQSRHCKSCAHTSEECSVANSYAARVRGNRQTVSNEGRLDPQDLMDSEDVRALQVDESVESQPPPISSKPNSKANKPTVNNLPLVDYPSQVGQHGTTQTQPETSEPLNGTSNPPGKILSLTDYPLLPMSLLQSQSQSAKAGENDPERLFEASSAAPFRGILDTSPPTLMVGWLCLTSHRQRGHLETAPPFTVPCEGREAR